MIISHSKKFIFVKTGKTAGSTVEKILSPFLDKNQDVSIGSKIWKDGHRQEDSAPTLNLPDQANIHAHMTIKEISDIFFKREIPDDYFTFCVERNSYDKLVSHYHWHTQQKRIQKGMHPLSYTFNQYVKKLNKEKDTERHPSCWRRYTINDKIAVTKIFQYNNLHEMLTELKEKFNLNMDVDEALQTKLKSSNRPNTTIASYYKDPQLKSNVDQMMEKEIKYFGYTL